VEDNNPVEARLRTLDANSDKKKPNGSAAKTLETIAPAIVETIPDIKHKIIPKKPKDESSLNDLAADYDW
jgi:hypothetical protein